MKYVFFLLSLFVPFYAYTQPVDIDVVLVMGQSNALGYPNDGDYYTNSMPAHLKANQDEVLSWNWTYAKWSNEPLHPVSWRYWGVELSYLYDIVESQGRTMALVKCAYGSTALGDEWDKDTVAQSGPEMYTRSVDYYNLAITELKALGYNPTLRQMVWIQGEDDTLNSGSYPYNTAPLAYAEDYYDNFVRFWSYWSADTGVSSDTSIIIAPLIPAYAAGSEYADAVKSNQVALAANFSNIELLDMTDAVFYSGPHYSGEFYITMGERCASNYLSKFAASLEFCNIPDFSETPYSLNWFGSSNQIYRVESSTNLIAGFEIVAEHIQGTEGTNSFIVDGPPSAYQRFYRIKLEDTID